MNTVIADFGTIARGPSGTPGIALPIPVVPVAAAPSTTGYQLCSLWERFAAPRGRRFACWLPEAAEMVAGGEARNERNHRNAYRQTPALRQEREQLSSARNVVRQS